MTLPRVNRLLAPGLWAIVLLMLCACGGSDGSSSSSSSAASSSDESRSSSSASSEPGSSSSESGSSSSPANIEPSDGFQVKGAALYDVTGAAFVMRGVNYPYAWYRGLDTEQQFADIASTGANTVRVVLSNGEQWNRVSGDEVADIINWAKQHRLVTMLEVHDVTGSGENDNAADPQTAVDYWLSEDIRAAIVGEEAHVLVNIANEPLGNNSTDDWVPFHVGAVEALRAGGLTHTLVVDAPNWGQDWQNVMRDGSGAQTIFDADVQANVIFSIHMYQVYSNEAAVSNYFDSFADKGLPLIVGEFAADHGNDGDVAEGAILAGAESHGFGYLGWSWSGNSDGSNGGSDLSSLDIVESFNVEQLSPWGEILINSDNGIRATGETCQCFLTDEE